MTRTASRTFFTSSILVLLTACGGGSSGDDDQPLNDDDIVAGDDDIVVADEDNTSNDQNVGYVTPANLALCSTEDIQGRVGFDMLDYYIYYDQVSPLPASNYDSPEDYIRALRVDPDIYSFVTNEAEQGALVDEGMATGFGFWFRPASDGVVRFREILIGSPASQANIARGDELVSLNGQLIGDYTTESLQAVFSADPASLDLQVRTGQNAARNVRLNQETYRWVTARPVVFRAEGLPTVGVIEVRRFLETTEAEIDSSIDFLLESNIDELIVDLRYNPGGRTRVAERLAAQIAGASIDGLPFLVRSWNDKYSGFNSTTTLEATTPSLSLPRIIVLQTEFSASASEAFVNGLEPYIDVTVIGGTTEGKIFTSNERTYCGKSIFAMRSIRTNSLGVSVLGGIQPDCAVSDDWILGTNFAEDALTSAGLNYVLNGTCPNDLISATPRIQSATGLSFRGSDELPQIPGDVIN